MVDPAFLRRTDRGVTVALRAQPRALRTALECSTAGALKVAITAPAEDGKANAAVIALLASQWHLPRSTFDVVRVMSVRDKVFSISGEPAALADKISEWMRDHG